MDSLEKHGVVVIHHFSDREYAKETRIPAGVKLLQHRHKFSHLSILASGTAIVHVDVGEITYKAPECLTIKAGALHSVTALTDVVWYCIHATDGETEVAAIESEIVEA